MYYVFDVDGTLTPSRGVIDAEFAEWFKQFMQTHRVCFVTGSDRSKTVEQLGEEIFNLAEYSFNCLGNEVYYQGTKMYSSDWLIPVNAWLWLEEVFKQSPYTEKVGNHFEQRTGSVNFSIVGRRAVGRQRTDYYEWDKIHQERADICKKFNETFWNLQAQIGGETGIDIFPKGQDKSQIIKYIPGFIKFYGDRMDPEGNDRPLADVILANSLGKCYNVSNWQETWELLKNE